MKTRCIHVGVGGRGVWPVKLFANRSDFESAAFVDVKAENIATARALNPNIPEACCFSSLEEAMEKVEADAVVIITPPQLHFKQCMAAVRAGKHVLVEKPFTLSLAEGRQVMAEADKRGAKVCVGQQAFYHGGNATIGRLVGERTYGRAGCGLMAKYGWRPKVHHSGAMRHAYIWERAVHDLDTIRAVFGEEVKRVSAISFNPTWSPYAHGSGNHAWFEFESGATCGYSCTFATYGPGWALRVDCEQASLVEANKEKQVHIYKPGAKEPEKIAWDPSPAPETIILDGWARYIGEDVEPRFGGHENLKTIALCEALGVSSDEGRIVEPARL